MAGPSSLLGQASRNRIVRAVRDSGGLTQVELSAATGLSAATVSALVKELAGAGVFSTSDTIHSGRRAVRVTLNPRVGVCAAVHIGPRNASVALADAAHRVVTERTLPLPFEHRPDTTIKLIATLIVEMLTREGFEHSDLLALGVGLPMPVDPDSGIAGRANFMAPWSGVAVGEAFSRRLGCPAMVDKSAHFAAVAEAAHGVGRAHPDMIYVHASHNVSGAVVVDGRLARGSHGTAGEFGHVTVDPAGDICECGSRGCLTTIAGAQALTAPLRATRGSCTLADVVAGAIDGDPGCVRVVADAGAAIGGVVANAVVTLGSSAVVVGGELAATGDVLMRPLRQAVTSHGFFGGGAPILVSTTALEGRPDLLGALTVAVSQVDLALPQVRGA